MSTFRELLLFSFSYRLRFTSSDQSAQSIYFFLVSFLVGYMFLESVLFLLGCPVCWHIIVHIFFFLVFLQHKCYFSSFSYYFICFADLPLLLREPGQKFVSFVYLLNELALGFIDFYFCFLISISSLIFIISFLLLPLAFVCSFFLLILLDVRLGCLLQIFLICLKKTCIPVHSPLNTAFVNPVGSVCFCLFCVVIVFLLAHIFL